MAKQYTDETFEKEVINGEGLVLVDFWADWCGPCHMLAPVIEQIAEESIDGLSVGKVDVDANPQTAGKYQIMSIPTVMLFKDGEPVETFVGVQPKEAYLAAIEKHK